MLLLYRRRKVKQLETTFETYKTDSFKMLVKKIMRKFRGVDEERSEPEPAHISSCDKAAAEAAQKVEAVENKAKDLIEKFHCNLCEKRARDVEEKESQTDKKKKKKYPPIRAILAVLGGFLIQLTFGSFYR